MRQRGERTSGQPDPLEPVLPRLGEAVPGLGAVADDGEAARRAAQQQHLPLGVGQLLGLVDDDVRERAGERVGSASGSAASSTRASRMSCWRSSSSAPSSSSGCDQVVDDPVHPFALRGDAASCARSRRDVRGRRAAAGRRPGGAGRRPSRPGRRGAAASRTWSGRARGRTGAGTRAPTTGRRRGRSPRSAATRGRRRAPARRSARATGAAARSAAVVAVVLVRPGSSAAPPTPGRAPRCAACRGPATRTPPPSRRR